MAHELSEFHRVMACELANFEPGIELGDPEFDSRDICYSILNDTVSLRVKYNKFSYKVTQFVGI